MQGSGAAHWDGYQYTYMPPGSGGHNAMAHAHRGPAAMTGYVVDKKCGNVLFAVYVFNEGLYETLSKT